MSPGILLGIKVLLILLFVIGIVCFSIFYNHNSSIYEYVLSVAIPFGIYSAINVAMIGKLEILGISLKEYNVMRLAIVLIMLGFIFAKIAYIDIKYNDVGKKNGIIFNNRLINSNKQYYYIGQTEKYVIFYNEKTQMADIYPIAYISKISVIDN